MLTEHEHSTHGLLVIEIKWAKVDTNFFLRHRYGHSTNERVTTDLPLTEKNIDPTRTQKNSEVQNCSGMDIWFQKLCWWHRKIFFCPKFQGYSLLIISLAMCSQLWGICTNMQTLWIFYVTNFQPLFLECSSVQPCKIGEPQKNSGEIITASLLIKIKSRNTHPVSPSFFSDGTSFGQTPMWCFMGLVPALLYQSQAVVSIAVWQFGPCNR